MLSEQQITQIKEQFNAHVRRTSYNDVAPTLELMAFWREAKKQNPSLTLKQAFAMFELKGGALVDKYHGGNCFSLAENFGGELKQRGIDSYMVGQEGFNAALVLSGSIPRVDGLRYIERAHGSLLIPYKTPQGEVRYLHIETGVGMEVAPRIHGDFDQIKRQAYAKPEQPILNPSDILRNRMRLLNDLVITDMNKNPSPTLKVNMIDGTLTLRHLDGLTLKPGETQAKVDFVKMLQTGDHQRLIELLTVAQRELNQPPTFVQDMLTLMGSRLTGDYAGFVFEDAQALYDVADNKRARGGR